MTTAKLFVRMNYIEGALARLLGLAGRRGFDIASVQARRSDDAHGQSWYEVVLELAGARPVSTLHKQIAKLYDVETVEVMAIATAPVPVPDAPSIRLVEHAAG